VPNVRKVRWVIRATVKYSSWVTSKAKEESRFTKSTRTKASPKSSQSHSATSSTTSSRSTSSTQKSPYSPSRASQDHGTRSMRDATSFDSPTKPKYAAVVPSHLPRSQSFDLALLPSSSNTVDPRNKNNMMKRLKECKYGLDHDILGKRIAQIGEQACIEISSSNNIDMLHKLLNLVFAMESFVMDKKKTDNITADDGSRCNYPRLYKSKAKEKTSKNTTPKRSIEVSISKQKRDKSTDSRFKSPNGKPEAQNNGKQSKFSNYNSRKSIKNKDNQEIQTAYNSENRIIKPEQGSNLSSPQQSNLTSATSPQQPRSSLSKRAGHTGKFLNSAQGVDGYCRRTDSTAEASCGCAGSQQAHAGWYRSDHCLPSS
jgi:hypothetical protein